MFWEFVFFQFLWEIIVCLKHYVNYTKYEKILKKITTRFSYLFNLGGMFCLKYVEWFTQLSYQLLLTYFSYI